MKNVLSIAGSDCSAGAGIQADLKTFAALGVYGLTVITSITAQNTQRVRMIEDVSNEVLNSQLEVLFEDMKIDAVKIGMINSKKNVEIIYENLVKNEMKNIVIDPVMISTSGKKLLEDEAKEVLIEKLFRIADLVCPNLLEALEIIKYISKFEKIETNIKQIKNINEMIEVGKIISKFTKNWVLIKGGHLEKDDEAVDVLIKDEEKYIFRSPKINTKNTHGTGCTLSSAIATNLAKGYSMVEAIEIAKRFISQAIENSIDFGKENGPVNQMGKIYKNIDIENFY